MDEVKNMNWYEVFEGYKDEFMKDLQGLIAIPSIKDMDRVECGAPFGVTCREALDYMLQLAESYGFETMNYDGYAGVVCYGEGTKSVGLLAHLDIVPEGEGWTKDPFTLHEEAGYLFGRGVLDDKGAALAGLYALRMLKDHQIQFPNKILAIFGCDEESGSACMKHYRKVGEIPVTGFTPDANFPVIYGEKGGLHVKLTGLCKSVITHMNAGERSNIVIGKASLSLQQWDDEKQKLFDFYLKSNGLTGRVSTTDETTTLLIEGVFAHAATPYLGVNAALHLLNFVGSAYQDKFAMDTYALLNDWQGKPLGINMEGAYMGFLTMNTGIIKIEDHTADITIDIRYPNDASVDDIMKNIEAAADACAYELDVRMDGNSKPLFVDPQSTLVKTLHAAYTKYTNDTFTPDITIGGGTYAKAFDNFVAFGPEFPIQEDTKGMFVGSCHQRDEGILKENLFKAVAIYTDALEKLAEKSYEDA